ncbi:hypothetical protein PM082_008725 [Marasmius tenuissimus]|nr:hypothetical protein PM082_008725 [Marasmius tenuissimus]
MYLYDSRQVKDLIRKRAEACGYDVPVPSYALPECISPPVKSKIDHRYVPIESDPKDIIWEGQHVSSGMSVRVEDACILYPVKPHELKDLTARSPWLDVKTVAMRAAQLRGGVHKCNKFGPPTQRTSMAIGGQDSSLRMKLIRDPAPCSNTILSKQNIFTPNMTADGIG